ncbi:MAG: dockerin type I domain-containing protein [Phycisphaerales bacterium]|nr:dockerin type I domain-containing protein [Phycisphaerales bacterium]
MFKTVIAAGLLCGGVVLLVQDDVTAGGNQGTVCNGVGPDVIVGAISGISNYSSVAGIEAFAFGTDSCNIGSEELLWNSGSNQKPIIGQSVYRLKDGRLEQLAQGWLKHGFFALSDDLCGCSCAGTDGSTLGVGCSDLYNSGLNGQQTNMGPKYEVNAFTGDYPYPATNLNTSGDGIYKRVQVKISDIDPSQDGGGQYFVEGQYVSPDDAAAGNGDNNGSWRELTVSGSGGTWNFNYLGDTFREQQAIYAWAANDSGVDISQVRVENEGLVLLGSKVTDLGGGLYDYEYAVQNFNSDRSIGSVRVPISDGAQVSNIGFHDVDYHSGSPIDGSDWSGAVGGGYVTWECPEEYDDNIWANAIRWGTMYNFRFRTNVAPTSGNLLDLGIFKPAAGNSNAMVAQGAAYLPTGDVQFVDCNDNGVADDEDISGGSSNDCNTNGLPDECEADLECPPDLSIALVGEAPATIDPDGGTEIVVEVEELLGTLLGVELSYTADGVKGSVPFSSIGGAQYAAAFPSLPCETSVTWRAIASSNEGNDYGTAENDSIATILVIVFEDEGESSVGWSVDCDASDGCWERGVPVGGGDRGDPEFDCDGSGSCWLTDNVAGNSDVDGGPTRLVSPTLDASLPGSVLSYCRWFSNDFGAAPGEDAFVVEVSDDGGATWEPLETVGPTGPGTSGGWIMAEFAIADIAGIVPSDQFVVRFTVSDEGSGSVIEAGIDGMSILASDCEDVSCPEDVTGDGNVTVVDLLAVIAEWNCVGVCSADINGDLIVNVTDLLAVIAAWNSCN